ncbi:cobalamin biosynthesis protein, partial [Klebsiella pneumoniae]|nr:cobalamin biosynthesis protein [Klebsiella pneumoniae]
LSTLLDRQLAAQRLDPLALKAIVSVSLKTNEPGLRQLAHRFRVPFETFSAEALLEHDHRFPASSFVRETVGFCSVS